MIVFTTLMKRLLLIEKTILLLFHSFVACIFSRFNLYIQIDYIRESVRWLFTF